MRTILTLAITAALAGPAFGEAVEHSKVLSSVQVDFDGDGKLDRAELVVVNPATAESEFSANGHYMVGDAERVDLVLTFDAASGKPALVKKSIVNSERAFMVSALESKGNGSLSVSSCFGCGAMKSWDETLTIAYRDGRFVVAGLTRDWEWATHLADGNVSLVMGGCDINYLTGEGLVSKGLDAGKPLKTRFKLTKLAGWTDRSIPKACEFY